MFQLMIADDNPFILKALCNDTDWEDFDLNVAGTFPNGKALLDAARSNMPDVILTDISMPIMDGISLATAIRQLSSDVKIIFISSYTDFEYAQKALSMQISGYILKPFEPEQLAEVMNKVLDELRKESFRRFERDRSLHRMETLRSIALENYMAELLYHAKENSLVLAQLNELQFTLFPEYELQVAAVSLYCDQNDGGLGVDERVAGALEQADRIRSILYGYPSGEYRFILIPVDTCNMAVLLIRSTKAPDTANLLAQLHVDIETMTGLSTIIGYSKTADSFSLVMGLFAQANAAKDSTSSASVIGYDDIQTESSRKNTSALSKEHVRKMKEYIAEHYKEPITMHDVATAVFLSSSYANHCFYSECGCSIFDFITQSRINEAKRLLLESDEQITMISELVGYNGKTNFYLAFKKNVGMSPMQFRRNYSEE